MEPQTIVLATVLFLVLAGFVVSLAQKNYICDKVVDPENLEISAISAPSFACLVTIGLLMYMILTYFRNYPDGNIPGTSIGLVAIIVALLAGITGLGWANVSGRYFGNPGTYSEDTMNTFQNICITLNIILIVALSFGSGYAIF